MTNYRTLIPENFCGQQKENKKYQHQNGVKRSQQM
jgi:hypothetical protein